MDQASLVGQGYTPPQEDADRLAEIDAKLKLFVSEEDWNTKQLVKPKQPTMPKTQSTIHVTEDGSIRRIGKTSGIDYLREQREERMQRQKMAEINESIANLYK